MFNSISLDILSGQAIVDVSVTNFTDFVIRGVAKYTNFSSTTPDVSNLVNPFTVWDNPTAKLLLGLAGKHQRIFPVTFDTFGNMEEGFMRIYDTKAHADANTNHIAQIELTGEYDGINKPKIDVGLKQVLLP